ncbi:MAG: hypothetical protein MH137_06720, partial [Flavobacteriales bacterium]|nr:hypothetical protein [Flavobacteriales bacterium]
MKKQILKTIFAGFCILLMKGIVTAQIPAVPTLSFTAPDTVTVGQSFFISNTSTAIPNGTVFTWEIESQTDRQFQAKDTLINIVTTSVIPISYAYLHEGAFKITLNATGINEFQKTIWVKGLINSSCTQYLQNYNYVDCEYVANGSFEDYTALATGTYSPSIQNFCPWRFNPWIYTLGSADQYHQNNNAQILSVPANGSLSKNLRSVPENSKKS